MPLPRRPDGRYVAVTRHVELTPQEVVLQKLEQLHAVLARDKFPLFRKRYLPQAFPDGPFHSQMMKDLEESNRLCQAAPRYFAKTVIGARDWTIYVALTGKRKNIMILSATGALAVDILRQIKHELEYNQKLIQDYGKQDTEKWTEDHIILANGVSIRAKGIGYQVRGFHPDLFICDDLENDENIRSVDQREKLRDWFLKVVLGTVDDTAQLVVQGTVLHPTSLLAELLADPTRTAWCRRKYAALVNGESIWPSRWPVETLERKRQEIGSLAFLSEYMNDPLSVKDAVIPQDWIQYAEDFPRYEDELRQGRYVPVHYYTAVDPAISEKDSADQTAIVTVGVVSDGPRQGEVHVANVTAGRWSLYQTIEHILKIYDRFKPRMVGVETTAFQKALKDTVLVEGRRRGVYLPVIELKADKDKIRRLMEVSPMIEHGQVKFRRHHVELIEQLVTMSPVVKDGHDDLVDALVYALSMVQKKPLVSQPNLPPPTLPSYQPARVSEGMIFTAY